MTNEDRGTEAFYRLLADANAGGQPKVDALVALSQRTVWVALWTKAGDWRTLRNSQNDGALPIFTSEEQLRAAGARFGWAGPSGELPMLEVGARAAFRYAAEQDLGFVVVDIAAEHSIEAEHSEFQPLLQMPDRKDSNGPFAAVGKISEQMLASARPGPVSGGSARPSDTAAPPSSSSGARPTEAASGSSSRRPRPRKAFQNTASSGRPVSGIDWRIAPLAKAPTDDFLDALSEVLRDYPEVEWASLCLLERDDTDPSPAIVSRIDPSFRDRVDEIVANLVSSGAEFGVALEVMLLEDPERMRQGREVAQVFYPWRR